MHYRVTATGKRRAYAVPLFWVARMYVRVCNGIRSSGRDSWRHDGRDDDGCWLLTVQCQGVLLGKTGLCVSLASRPPWSVGTCWEDEEGGIVYLGRHFAVLSGWVVICYFK